MTNDDSPAEGRRLLQRLITIAETSPNATADGITEMMEVLTSTDGVWALVAGLSNAQFVIDWQMKRMFPIEAMRRDYIRSLFAKLESL